LKAAKKFQSALRKLRGIRMWNRIMKDIKTYGTSTNLFDVNDRMKKNVSEVL
jgi:hypothetical protein